MTNSIDNGRGNGTGEGIHGHGVAGGRSVGIIGRLALAAGGVLVLCVVATPTVPSATLTPAVDLPPIVVPTAGPGATATPAVEVPVAEAPVPGTPVAGVPRNPFETEGIDGHIDARRWAETQAEEAAAAEAAAVSVASAATETPSSEFDEILEEEPLLLEILEN